MIKSLLSTLIQIGFFFFFGSTGVLLFQPSFLPDAIILTNSEKKKSQNTGFITYFEKQLYYIPKAVKQMSYMRIKCFNRQDKSTSIYYIYVLKHMHRNHAKIQTKRVPNLSSPLDGFFKLLASHYKKQPSYPHPQKTRAP